MNHSFDTNRSAFTAKLAFACAVLLFAGYGCSTDSATPLGCNPNAGSYYDPATKSCIKPATGEQAYALAQTRRLNQLADQTTSAEFQILFRRYLTVDEFTALLSDLHPLKITRLNLLFPSVDGGETIGSSYFSTESPAEAPRIALNTLLSGSGMLEDPLLRSNITAAFDHNDYKLWMAVVTTDPKAVRDWWTAHANDVRVVQARVSDLDKTQLDYCPTCSMP